MVHLLNKKSNNKEWMGWAIGVTILIIAGLASAFSGFTFSLVRDMRAEFLQEFKEMRVANARQDEGIAILKTHQGERLERERLERGRSK